MSKDEQPDAVLDAICIGINYGMEKGDCSISDLDELESAAYALARIGAERGFSWESQAFTWEDMCAAIAEKVANAIGNYTDEMHAANWDWEKWIGERLVRKSTTKDNETIADLIAALEGLVQQTPLAGLDVQKDFAVMNARAAATKALAQAKGLRGLNK